MDQIVIRELPGVAYVCNSKVRGLRCEEHAKLEAPRHYVKTDKQKAGKEAEADF